MNYRSRIVESEKLIKELHDRIHLTVKSRNESSKHFDEWSKACSKFHEQYSKLAFIGGVNDYRDRIRAGDQEAIEYAICFIEVRPFFFRSGYMYQDLMRVLKSADLKENQRKRYLRVRTRYIEFLKARNVKIR